MNCKCSYSNIAHQLKCIGLKSKWNWVDYMFKFIICTTWVSKPFQSLHYIYSTQNGISGKEVKCVVCFHEVRSVIIIQRSFQSTNANLSIWKGKNPHAAIGHIRVSPKLNVLHVKNKIFRLFFHWWINYGWYLTRHVGTVHHVHFSRFRQFS
jgi:hypothetical protein